MSKSTILLRPLVDPDIWEYVSDRDVTAEVKLYMLHAQQLRLLKALLTLGAKIMATLEDVKAAVAAEKTVVDSAITLLKGLHDQLAAAIASNDPAALQAVADDLKAQTDSLAAAVAANTTT